VADEAYYRWLNAGKPYHLAYGPRDLKITLVRHGYTVWDYPNEPHQKAEPPQDHTAYSATGWPVPSPEWYGHALDIPQVNQGQRSKVNGLPLPPIEVLSAQILKDRKAGHDGIDWLKYMNRPASSAIWTQPFYQERFMPDYDRRTSTDWGHIHLSGRSDRTRVSTEATRAYDPVARAQGVENVDLTPANLAEIAAANWAKEFASYVDPDGAGPVPRPKTSVADELYSTRREATFANQGVQQLLARPSAPPAEVDQEQLDASVRSALSDPAVVASIAAATADEIWRRMQPGT
jgi:hypothetical protein